MINIFSIEFLAGLILMVLGCSGGGLGGERGWMMATTSCLHKIKVANNDG